MTKALRRVLATSGALFLTGVLALATSPVQASSVNQRIDTLEQELTRLKQEQTATREQAAAAVKKMPLFIYRPGSGLTIAAADDMWEVQIGNRLQVYWTFWTKGGDGTSIPSKGTTNGTLTIRRFRPYMNTRVKDGFYDLRFKLSVTAAGSPNFFDAEMYIHFEQISPWLPYFGFGATPSAILNPNSNNMSSSRGARSEPGGSLAGQWGPATGSQDRGVGFVWRKIPRLGPMRITFFNVWMGQDKKPGLGLNTGVNITRDGRSFLGGLGVKPFDKLGGGFGKIMKGLQLSFGTVIQRSPGKNGTGFDQLKIRTSQTRLYRTSLIRGDSAGMSGTSYYFTPGIQWKWKWIELNFAGHYKNARLCDPCGGNQGAILRSNGFQIIGQFWLWSPKKGLLAGNPREGGLMVSPMFGRVDVRQSGDNTLRGCDGCKSAHAVQSGIAVWYYLRRNFNVGLVWDHWLCQNCNDGVSAVVPDGVGGGNYDFDTITLISRFQF
jgi:hypothetical protein